MKISRMKLCYFYSVNLVIISLIWFRKILSFINQSRGATSYSERGHTVFGVHRPQVPDLLLIIVLVPYLSFIVIICFSL